MADMQKTKGLLFGILSIISITIFGQTSWTSLKDIPTKWIKLERDSLGYLVYTPCDGETPAISIDSGYITIYWQLDAPEKLSIEKFTRLKGNKAFYINAFDGTDNTEFNVEIKNGKKHIILWTFGDFKWVMTPFEYKSTFRQVNNPCPTEMKPEKEFLPVEY